MSSEMNFDIENLDPLFQTQGLGWRLDGRA